MPFSNKPIRLLWIKTIQFFLPIAFVFFMSIPSAISASLLDGKNILILHSYHPTYVFTDQEMNGIMRVFHKTDPNYMPYVEYFDWKRFPVQANVNKIRETLRAKYAGIRIDAVIATDNKALEFALENRAQMFPEAAISFSGINGYKHEMIKGYDRVSGIIEEIDPSGTIDLIMALLPETRLIAVLVDDSESSSGVLSAIEQALARRQNLTLRVIKSPNQQELIEAVSSLKTGSVLIQANFSRDRDGRTYEFENILAFILPHTQVPIFSLWDFLAGKGITGGSLLSGDMQGESAAQITLRQLSGEKNVPVITNIPMRLLLDYNLLKRFGLENNTLPKGVEVINKPVSFFKTYLKTIIAVLLTIATLIAIIAALFLAIRKKQQAELSLRESEEHYRSIIDNLQDVYYRSDVDGYLTMVSPSGVKLLGYNKPEDIIGLKIRDSLYYDPSERDALIDELKNKVYLYSYEVRLRHKDGSPIQVATSSHLMYDASGVFIGVEGIFRDISQDKKAAEERLMLEQQLLHAQKLESLGVLAGGIAHDFNNILTSILGNAELAKMQIDINSPAVRNLDSIEQSAGRAADLANQMLAYSGKGRFMIEYVNINRLIEELLHMLEVSISRRISLSFTPVKPLPAVEADATQIRQVLMNLVINASEAIGDRHGTITVSTGCIECQRSDLNDIWLNENTPEGMFVFVEVTDSGCGMDNATLAKIFEPFFTTKFTGRGLGMAAVLGIVRGHKGAIEVHSEPYKGTSFKVMFPASDGPADDLKEKQDTNELILSGTVLLVDDEDAILSVAADILQALGFNVIKACNGLDALEKFQTGNAIDLVVMDLTMPLMDGEQCFQELIKIKHDIKVIIASGYNELEVSKKFIGKDLAGFIQKPYTINSLKKAVKTVLNQ